MELFQPNAVQMDKNYHSHCLKKIFSIFYLSQQILVIRFFWLALMHSLPPIMSDLWAHSSKPILPMVNSFLFFKVIRSVTANRPYC